MTDFNEWNRRVIAEFRANEGKVGGQFEGVPLLILHTTGARSGQERLSPLAYNPDADTFVIIASKGGAPAHPDWYHNLVAHPDVTLEVGTEHFPARAEVPAEPARTRLYDAMAAKMPNFAEYQRNTTRTIPVVVLRRSE